MIRSAKIKNELQNGKNKVASTVSISRACSLCRKPSVCCCQRCGDFYCSPECQRKDWHSHRYICFPLPPLVHMSCLSEDSTSKPKLPILMCSPQLQQILNIPQQQPPSQNYSTAQFKNCDIDAQNKKVNNEMDNNKHRSTFPPISRLPKANSCVLLTGFRSPNRCYVRALTGEENDGYLCVLKHVDTYGKKALPLSQLPKPNSYAIAPLDGVMYRVEVLSARNVKSIRVSFCDYGITAVRQLAELRECSDDVLRLQQHTVMVQLRNVENYTINEKLSKYLSQFEDKEFKIKFGPDDERGGNVELTFWETERSLNEEIVQFCKNLGVFIVNGTLRSRENVDKSTEGSVSSATVATSAENSVKEKNRSKTSENITETEAKRQETTLVEPILAIAEPQRQIRGPVMTAPFETHTFKEGSANIKAIVVDDSCLDFGYFGCIADEDFSNLAAVQKHLKGYHSTREQPYEPKLNEYCIAKFENDWYRAKVIELPDATHYTVMYIDFTNENTLTREDIRRYPVDLKRDCRTNLCLIVGLPTSLTTEHVKFLRSVVKLQSTIIIDQVKGIEEGIILVECQKVIKLMNEQGLI